jgi:endonuclease G
MKRNKGFWITIIILIVIGIGIYLYFNYIQAQPIPANNTYTSYKPIPELEIPCGTQYIKHSHYAFEYKEEHEQSIWVAYMLTSKKNAQTYKRSNSFYPDPLVSTETATNKDYSKSGYDKGHLAPAADMNWSEQAIKESFYFSNISPQLPAFNRGIWKTLEEQVRTWAQKFDTLYIVTGPIVEPGLPTIGENKVSIPNYFYKAILVYSYSRAFGIGFILPHAASNNSIYSFVVPIDSIESKIHRDLFCKLPDTIEEKIESSTTISD